MSDPNDPVQVYTVGLPGPSGLPMVWQGAQLVLPNQSPFQASMLQPISCDVRSGAINILLPAIVDNSTSVIAVKDYYMASGRYLITLQPQGAGNAVEDPSNRGNYVAAAPWPHLPIPPAGTGIVWLVGMASTGAWVVWAT